MMPRSLAAERLIPVYRSKPAKIPTDLYFVETDCAERHIKIGITSNIKDRVATMQMHCPYKIVLLKLVPGCAHMEKDLHIRFASDRIVGEWFKRSDDLLAVVEGLDGRTEIEPKKPVDLGFEDMSATWREFHTKTGRYAFMAEEEDALQPS